MSVRDILQAAAGVGGPYVPPAGFYQVGTISISPTPYNWRLSVSPDTDAVVYAVADTLNINGQAKVYKSVDGGATWQFRGSYTGTASQYASGIVALSNTTIIVQNRGSIAKSTDSGATFTTLRATSGGQNNMYDISWDGQYGLNCGYSRNYYSLDNFATVSEVGLNYGFSLGNCTLTNNKSNRFLVTPLGSSSSGTTAYITNASLSTTYASIGVFTNSTIPCSYPATGRNYIVSYNGVSLHLPNTIITSVWPSTTYTSVTGPSVAAYSTPTVHSVTGGVIIGTQSNGVYLCGPTGSPTQISAVNGFYAWTTGALVSYGILQNGTVYRYW